MKIKVICIGKTGKDFLVEGEQEYIKRLAHYIPTEKIELPDIKNAKSLSEEQVKQQEGKAFLAKIESSDYLILLDEKGTTYSSEKFAQYLQLRFNSGGKNLVFLIGGAYGFSEEYINVQTIKLLYLK